jgi:hypothetical protein
VTACHVRTAVYIHMETTEMQPLMPGPALKGGVSAPKVRLTPLVSGTYGHAMLRIR